jgi:hypothetical protein
MQRDAKCNTARSLDWGRTSFHGLILPDLAGAQVSRRKSLGTTLLPEPNLCLGPRSVFRASVKYEGGFQILKKGGGRGAD